MSSSDKVQHISLSAAARRGPSPPGNLAIPIFSSGTLVVELYEPKGVDTQKPHARDEVYIVARGRGCFLDGEERHAVDVGSFIFVPAGQPHRFEELTEDFAVWVFFYGHERGQPVDDPADSR